jgi:GNAT superfamily N-acetyltransferase
MGTMEFKVRRMLREEIDLVVEWANEEGWNPGLYDAGAFFETDPSAFWAGELGGKVISMISGVPYDSSYGFTGLYITHPDYRHQGFGGKLLDTVHSEMGSRVLGSDAVGEATRILERGGYKAAHTNIRYEALTENFGPFDSHVVNVNEVPFDQLDTYDQSAFTVRRSRFLKGWISRPSTAGAGYLHDGKLLGYGVIRPCRIGWKIGPLFADNDYVAERLYEVLSSHAPSGEVLFIDVPEPNELARALAERFAMIPVFETTRMYRNGVHEPPLNRWFGVTSNELG